MADKICCAACSVIMLALALSFMVAGLLTTGWAECKGIEYGVYEACTPAGSCQSYDGGESSTAVEGLILSDIAAASISFIYLVIRLILMITTCGPKCDIKDLLLLFGLLLFLGGIACVAGVVVFSTAVEIPCDDKIIEYSAYITGVGGVLIFCYYWSHTLPSHQ